MDRRGQLRAHAVQRGEHLAVGSQDMLFYASGGQGGIHHVRTIHEPGGDACPARFRELSSGIPRILASYWEGDGVPYYGTPTDTPVAALILLG